MVTHTHKPLSSVSRFDALQGLQKATITMGGGFGGQITGLFVPMELVMSG